MFNELYKVGFGGTNSVMDGVETFNSFLENNKTTCKYILMVFIALLLIPTSVLSTMQYLDKTA